MISNRDWIQNVLDHREGDAVPYNFMFSPPAERLAQEWYGMNLEEALSLPIRMTGPKTIKPLYADPDEFGDTVADEFGVVWSTSKIDRGSPVGLCLPEADLSRYVFPDAADPARFTDIGTWCRRQEGHYRILWAGDLWERATFMRGMEQILLDIIIHPLFVQSLLDHLTEYIIGTIRELTVRGTFECIALSDDYGTQQGMLMSPEHWCKMVKPCLARIYAFAKKHKLAVFHHSCGNITPIIDDLIELGLDILHPIQPEAMDVFSLKKEYGRYVTFCGGVSTQRTLVSGNPDQVRAEVRKLKQSMSVGGGYILEPGITIQADIPRENLVAMIDEACRHDC